MAGLVHGRHRRHRLGIVLSLSRLSADLLGARAQDWHGECPDRGLSRLPGTDTDAVIVGLARRPLRATDGAVAGKHRLCGLVLSIAVLPDPRAKLYLLSAR